MFFIVFSLDQRAVPVLISNCRERSAYHGACGVFVRPLLRPVLCPVAKGLRRMTKWSCCVMNTLC